MWAAAPTPSKGESREGGAGGEEENNEEGEVEKGRNSLFTTRGTKLGGRE